MSAVLNSKCLYDVKVDVGVFMSRYDFRNRVADVLQMNLARVTILPTSPQSVSGGTCQQVNFMISGKAEQM